MNFLTSKSTFPRIVVVLLAGICLGIAGCSGGGNLPAADSAEYGDFVSAFYVGLAGLQTGDDIRAQQELARAAQLAPGEPAVWANLGVLALRHQDFDAAYENAEKARTLAPDDSRIEMLLGLIESRRGDAAQAIRHFNEAVRLDATNVQALYALAEETGRTATAGDAPQLELFERILAVQPSNIAVLLDVARIAARENDREALAEALSKLTDASAGWPADSRQQLAALRDAAARNSAGDVTREAAFLRNVLTPLPIFQKDLAAVRIPPESVMDPFATFIKVPSPSPRPAAPDMAITFQPQQLPSLPAEARNAGVIVLQDDAPPAVYTFDGRQIAFANGINLPFPARSAEAAQTPDSVLAADLNYDFRTDLVFAGDGGIRVYRQGEDGKFSDVTRRLGIPQGILEGSYSGAWALDVDLDGDLDLVLGSVNTPPTVLRNNGNGSFVRISAFAGVTGVRSLSTADMDRDGDPDVAMLDSQQRLHVFFNERLGQYTEISAPQSAGGYSDLAAADIDANGSIDFIVLRRNGSVARIAMEATGESPTSVDLIPENTARVSENVDGFRPFGLWVADLDNSGSLDLLVDGNVWLGTTDGGFEQTTNPVNLERATVADLNDDGRLDILGFPGSAPLSQPTALINRGQRDYHYQVLRTRAAEATGDQRINSFGIGGEIEIRSGLLTQKQAITSPHVHFGLGENLQADVARIVWPNGSVQAEFELKADQLILAEQRLKGSCPMLFAWDGTQFCYVKDTAPWSPALGLHINSQEVAGIYQTEEWFKIPGNRLVPRDGYYELRVTAELWETFYIDRHSLLAVDHPKGTEIFSDERFAVPPPPLKLYATHPPMSFAGAWDDLGHEVSDVVRDSDERYLDTFGKGPYQGVTRDHWVELELPAEAPVSSAIYLIGHGFVHPTDASINVAYSQTGYPAPSGLSIETPDSNGRWSTSRSGLGFPAGKLKTVVLDLQNIFRPGAPRKLRLRTNMEIYWDKLEWAEALPETTFTVRPLELSSAELRWRGFSRFTQADKSSPEIPDYNQLQGTSPKWRNLTGYYTRYGDVRELLDRSDDRIVIAGAGDELRLQFAELPPPPSGWVRDYVMVGDGWIKDGDLNSTFSKTVLPLPYHGLKDYNATPGRLQDDPAYKLHPEDWQTFHTRYVTPEPFLGALRN